jgi:hypothetical protein
VGATANSDEAFALPTIYEMLEGRGVQYAIHVPGNDVLERAIEHLLVRPAAGQLRSAGSVPSVQYQVVSWDRPRRAIAEIEYQFGEPLPWVGFVVTS